MNSRIEELCSHVRPAKVFADVGCDHGYCTQIVLSRGLCEKTVISDISADSLKKAETLLKRYICEGKCRSYCTDGLNGIEERCDELLIAGMGGKEIIHILEKGYIPERFILQPMKNSSDLRRFLVSNGCFIECDYTAYFDKKFYDIIVGTNSCATEKSTMYKEVEFEFGRDNLTIGDERFACQIKRQLEISSSALERAKTQETVLRLEREKALLLQALEIIKGNNTK